MRQSTKSASLLPIQTDGADVVRFEKNLLQIGFFAANDTRKGQDSTRRVEQQVMRNGNKMTVAAEFRGSDALGLPSTTDRDKFIAFLKIAQEDKARNGLITNPVRFSGYRMIRELGLSRHGDIYDDIMRWGKRMTDTTITSEQVVYLAFRKVYSDEVLHVFRKFSRSGSSGLNESDRQESFEVVLEDWLLDNLNERYVIPEDFNTYKLLKRATAKGIFGYLHVWFHASMCRPVEKDYVDLCNLLNIQSYKHVSKIKETMGRALDELVQVRYLSQWDVQPMLSKHGYKLVLSVGDELLRLLRRDAPKALDQNAAPAKAPALTLEQQTAARALMAHAVGDEKASQLVEQYGADRVTDCVEYVESQLNTKREGGIGNPAGLIIYILKNNLPIPAAITEGRKQKQAQSLKEEYRRWLEKAIDEELTSRWPESKLEDRVAAAVREKSEQDLAFRKLTPRQQESLARQFIRKELLDGLSFPSMEEWSAGRPQYSLNLA